MFWTTLDTLAAVSQSHLNWLKTNTVLIHGPIPTHRSSRRLKHCIRVGRRGSATGTVHHARQPPDLLDDPPTFLPSFTHGGAANITSRFGALNRHGARS